jgi:hypothetical protein
MKSFSNYLYLFLIAIVACNQPQNQEETSAKIDDIISKMSVKEKVGQMTQLNLDVISVGEVFDLKEPHELDSAKLRKDDSVDSYNRNQSWCSNYIWNRCYSWSKLFTRWDFVPSTFGSSSNVQS